MKATIYGYKKCSTVRAAQKFLDDNNIEYTSIDMVNDGISQKTIKELLDLLKIDVDELINKRSITYRQLGLKDTWPNMTKQEKIRTLANNAKLIKRPILIKGKSVALMGFDEDVYKAKLLKKGKVLAKKK